MAKKLQLRRGTTSQHSSFTGAVGEPSYDSDKGVIVLHDGSNAGGTPMAKESVVNNIISGATVPTTIVTAMSGVNMDISLGEYFSKTVSGNTTFSFSNIPSGYSGWVLEVTNGGNHTVSWPSSVKWGGGVAAPLTSSGVDVIVFTSDDSGSTIRAGIFSTDNK